MTLDAETQNMVNTARILYYGNAVKWFNRACLICNRNGECNTDKDKCEIIYEIKKSHTGHGKY